MGIYRRCGRRYDNNFAFLPGAVVSMMPGYQYGPYADVEFWLGGPIDLTWSERMEQFERTIKMLHSMNSDVR